MFHKKPMGQAFDLRKWFDTRRKIGKMISSKINPSE